MFFKTSTDIFKDSNIQKTEIWSKYKNQMSFGGDEKNLLICKPFLFN